MNVFMTIAVILLAIIAVYLLFVLSSKVTVIRAVFLLSDKQKKLITTSVLGGGVDFNALPDLSYKAEAETLVALGYLVKSEDELTFRPTIRSLQVVHNVRNDPEVQKYYRYDFGVTKIKFSKLESMNFKGL